MYRLSVLGYTSFDRLRFTHKISISMCLLWTQVFINVAVRSLNYTAACFDPHLGHFQVNVLRKINYSCMCLFCCINC